MSNMFKLNKNQNKNILTFNEIKISIMNKNTDIYNDIARRMANKLKENNDKDLKTVFILPVGPRGQYRYFVKICNNENISCNNLITVNMDEFLDNNNNQLPKSSPFNFRTFMYNNFFNILKSRIKINPENIFFPDSKNQGELYKLLNEFGGADICFLGVGINGHVAFNEPISEDLITVNEFKKLKTRILDVSEETIIMTSLKYGGCLENVPRKCITIGMAEILLSKEIRIYLEHSHQAAILKKICYSKPTTEIPVTILKEHFNYSLTISKKVLDSYVKNKF